MEVEGEEVAAVDGKREHGREDHWRDRPRQRGQRSRNSVQLSSSARLRGIVYGQRHADVKLQGKKQGTESGRVIPEGTYNHASWKLCRQIYRTQL